MKLVPLLAGLAIGTGIALVVPVTALADHLADLQVATEDGTTTFTIHSVETGGQFIPAGGEPTEFPEDELPQAGDAFTFTDDLSQDGTLVGTDEGTCTVSDGGDEITCDVAITFAGGTIRALDTSPFTEDEEGEPFDVPLVSGTGAYEGIDGTATVVDNPDESQTITVEYTIAGESEGEGDGGATAAANEAVKPKSTTDGDEITIEVHAVETDFAVTDKDGELIDLDDELLEPRPGDVYSFTEELDQDGVAVGTAEGSCTVVRVAGEDEDCEITYDFPNGTIETRGLASFPDEGLPPPTSFAITGGTGAYSGAEGTLTFTFIDLESTDDVLVFTLEKATQVELVPVGGAATGGGAAGATDSALLIAVGAAAVAGGAGLFGAARYTARRSA